VLEPILTPRLRMRPFEPDDADAVFAIFSDPGVGDWVGGPHATVDDSRSLIERNREHQRLHGYALWAVEERESGALVGEVGLQLLELRGPETEIGWSIARRAWRRGYATEAAAAWLDVAFGPLALDAVVATTLPANEASRAVAARLGMRPAGRRHVHGADHDVWRISP
jgi:RimJ/RimL family protein N-acetyltransferase